MCVCVLHMGECILRKEKWGGGGRGGEREHLKDEVVRKGRRTAREATD